MKFILSILLLFFTWFSSSASFSSPKIVITNTPIFLKTESYEKSDKAKIGLQQNARSSIDDLQNQNTFFHQNTFSISSYLKEVNSCALNFEKTSILNQLSVAQFSNKERLNELENRARVRSLKVVNGAGKVFTVAELKALSRAQLSDFVRNNLDNLLTNSNRDVIWSLTDEAAGQFKRGDLIEEIFNQWPSKYGNYQNLNDIIPNYPTLDFDGILNNVNEVVSLKTYHPTSSTVKSASLINGKITNYTQKLSSATINAAHAGKQRVLVFTIKKGE